MDSFGTHGTNCNLHEQEHYIITNKFLVFFAWTLEYDAGENYNHFGGSRIRSVNAWILFYSPQSDYSFHQIHTPISKQKHKEFVCDYVILLHMQIAICAMCSKGVHVYSWNAS